MDTSCAYANLFLGAWEKHIFSDDQFSPFMESVLCWFRFINDLFVVWTGSSSLLQQFVEVININNMNFRFTVTLDIIQIPFLDLLIVKNPDGTLGTDLYHKPTAGNTLLHATSAHPKALVRSIPYAQYLRLRRNCTREEDFYNQSDALREQLLLRGYSKTNLRRAFNRAAGCTRTSLLYPSPRTTNTNTVKLLPNIQHTMNNSGKLFLNIGIL